MSVDTMAVVSSSKRPHGSKRHHHKPKAVVLGSGSVKLAHPGKGKLVIKLSAKGRRALRHVGRKGVRLTIKLTISTLSGTAVGVKTEQVTLHLQKKAPKKAAHRKRHH